MRYDEFLEIVAQLKQSNPIWFELDSDPPATKNDIKTAERQLNIIFPEEYKMFIQTFGGGYFAFTVIYSVSVKEEWSLVNQNKLLDLLDKQQFLAISDNQAGDYYGYKIEKGVSKNTIYVYDHEDQKIRKTKYQNLYEYLVEVGLKQ
ncbi:SMI1/KNR4 family protein [Saccharibacillus alkalitolerans]|uniref:SMI1/KNR4 family protein n=1 Tax=Saccharibacillus alkalitolerans TaxID=2705290 RepID=A0ABX0FCX8_9BACL|nr:SMI1/KNR4 family protein [Saccharibacillus alkalitolerans]NGZ77919.1 SMI1/KNR4 family protein [Saccharibacillus alkalitolerans]